MRLPTQFVRLPISVDAAVLAAEIASLPEELWRAHPEGAAGNTAVPLVAVRAIRSTTPPSARWRRRRT